GAPDRGEFILRRFGQGAEAVRMVFAALRDEEERFAATDPASREQAERLLATLEHQLLEAEKGRERTLAEAIAASLDHLEVKHLDVKEDARALVRGIAAGLRERIVEQAGVLNSHEVAQ